MNYLFNKLFGGTPDPQPTPAFTLNLSDRELLNWIKNTNILTSATKHIYLRKLMAIINDFTPSHPLSYWIIHPDEFVLSLQNYRSQISHSTDATSAQFMTPIISLVLHHQEIQEQYPTLLGQWKKVKNDWLHETNDLYLSNKPSAKQSTANIPFDELCSRRDTLPIGSDARLLISLYTYVPPVRADYWHMKIYSEDPQTTTENYLVLDKNESMIVLNQYKTAKVYGENIIPIPEPLYQEIIASLSQHPREYLFVTKKGLPYEKVNSWNVWANRLLRKQLNLPNFTITMFRHIYISREDLDIGNMTRKEKKEISDKMGHSLSTQDQYRWIDENDESS